MPRPVVPIAAAPFAASPDLIHHLVEWKDERARIAYPNPFLRRHAALGEHAQLFAQRSRRQHHPVPDQALHAVAHHTRGYEVQDGSLTPDDERVTGVVAALKPNDGRGPIGEPVDDLPLAFVAPLQAYDDYRASHPPPSESSGTGPHSAPWRSITTQPPPRRPRRRAPRADSPGRRWITRSPRDRRSRIAACRSGASDQGASTTSASAPPPSQPPSATSVFRSALNPVAARARPNTLPISSYRPPRATSCPYPDTNAAKTNPV